MGKSPARIIRREKRKPTAAKAAKSLKGAKALKPAKTRAKRKAIQAPAASPDGVLRPAPAIRKASHPASARRSGPSSAQDPPKYVYCVIQQGKPLSFGPLGLGAEPSEVYTVSYRDLAAVVSDTPMGLHDPTCDNVLAHQRVNETVMRDHTLIPMSFGTVFKTNQDIIELLRSAYDAFKDVLSKMQNKFEFGLKVLWERDQIIREIEDGDEDIRRLKSEISNQKGSTYFARMQYGRMIDASLQSRSEDYVSEIFGGLRDVSVASRSNKPIGDKMIMNAAFLVLRNQEKAFDAKVKVIGAKYPRLTFKYTGPWPPYNFVNIRLKLERAQ